MQGSGKRRLRSDTRDMDQPKFDFHDSRAVMDPVIEDLDLLPLREVLDQDSRPTFILDLDPDAIDDGEHLHPIYCNSALRLHESLHDALVGSGVDALAMTQDQSSYRDFRTWAMGVTKHDDSRDVFPLSIVYGDLLWTGSTVRQRWRLISGNLLWKNRPPAKDLSAGAPIEVAAGSFWHEQASEPPAVHRRPTLIHTNGTSISGLPTSSSSKPYRQSERLNFSKTSNSNGSTDQSSNSKQSIVLTRGEKAVTDWTQPDAQGILTPHLHFARTVDWGSTPLGPMAEWTPEFRQVVNLLMANPHPAALFWGSDLTMIYNEAYADEVAGHKHPSLMGTGFSGPFSELWDGVSPIFAECARTGISVRRENDYLPIKRHGFVEETFFSWSFTPLYGSTSRILGFYNAPFETTQMERNRRMLQTINTLGESISRAKTVKQFWRRVLDGLDENHFDVPFALLYSVGDSEEGDYSSISSGSTMSLKSCYLEGTLGIPEGHIAAPLQLDLKRSLEGFIPSFREAMRTRGPTLLHTRDGTLPDALLEGINWRGFGEPCHEAIIFPVRPTNGDMVLAFLLLGINPRRPYDDGYKSFVSMLNRQLATSLASIMLFEEEVRRSRDAAEAATMEQEKLSQQLALQTDRLRRMTELSPLGMFLISPEGVLREANDRFFEMTRLPKDIMEPLSWMACVAKCSMATIQEGWHSLVRDHVSFSGEIRLNDAPVRPNDSSDEVHIDSWVLFTAQVEFSADSSLRSIMGSITDISHLKWAQGLQNQRLQEAHEQRRQQNEFIDITSHEMRNPLSAILQCADAISSALEDDLRKDIVPSKITLEECVEAAHTIALCMSHQKAIVDDILTISKLDSNLLLITPIPSQPVVILKRAVRMVDPELHAKDIRIVFEISDSYRALNIDWAMLDPSRVLQILINLLTNAIKFTAGSSKRVITVGLGATAEKPSGSNIPGFQFVPTSKRLNDHVADGKEWGNGEFIFIRFRVGDTGCGLTHEEKQILFERFKQASPRTHAQYGGSGLGLFISKQLSELSGGSIGVASEAGVGSIFGFYVKARRCASLQTTSAELTQNDLPSFVQPQCQDLAGTSAVGGLVARKARSSFDPKALNILVVEDNLINQRVLVKQLKKFGSTVSVANDGIEALEHLQTTRYCLANGIDMDVILMDLEMPRMNGIDCVKRIREMQRSGEVVGHVPVIAVTANVRNEQIAGAKRSGMDDVVSKPFTIPGLIEKVGSLLVTLSSEKKA